MHNYKGVSVVKEACTGMDPGEFEVIRRQGYASNYSGNSN